MTAAEVFLLLKNSNNIFKHTFEEELVFDFDVLKIESLKPFNIEFITCTFKRGVTFKNLTTEGSRRLSFGNCIFEGDLEISKFSIDHFEISNCKFSRNVSFDSIKLKNSRFIFNNCDVAGAVDIIQISCLSIDLRFNKAKILYITQIESKKIRISCLSENIDKLEIENIEKVEHLLIENDDKIGLLKLKNAKDVKLEGDFKMIHIQDAQLTALSLIGKFREKKELGTIEKLVLRSSVISQNLILSDFTIIEVDFEDVSAISGSISFTNLILKKTHLKSVRASKFYLDLVEFKDQLIIKICDLSGLKPNNVTWLPNQVISPDNTNYKIPWFYRFRKKKTHDESLITELKQQRDAYRQLKVASQNNHNQVEALAFYRNEMRLYWKEIRLNGGISKSNHLLVFLNRWMSDFGQNYWLPLIWIIFFQTIFSVLIWYFEADPNCKIGFWTGFADYKLGIADYITWINPIFKAPDNWSDGAKITSFFMRIFNGFFIYHFIKAIRKYGKGE